MFMNTKLAALAALLVASVGVLGAPAPCDEPSSSSSTWGEPTSSSSSTWGEPTSSSSSTWGEPTSSSASTWGEPTGSPTWSFPTSSIAPWLGDGHHSHSWHHKSQWTSPAWSSSASEPTSSSSAPTTSATEPSSTWSASSSTETSSSESASSTWGASSSTTATPTWGSSSSSEYPWTTTTTLTVTATPTGSAGSGASCSTGPIQCCNSVQSASSLSPAQNATMHQTYGQDVLQKHGLLGAHADGNHVPVGTDCSPLSLVGIGGPTCAATPVCCENNDQHGLINIGCIPIIIVL